LVAAARQALSAHAFTNRDTEESETAFDPDCFRSMAPQLETPDESPSPGAAIADRRRQSPPIRVWRKLLGARDFSASRRSLFRLDTFVGMWVKSAFDCHGSRGSLKIFFR
jgi:hypothetical protein